MFQKGPSTESLYFPRILFKLSVKSWTMGPWHDLRDSCSLGSLKCAVMCVCDTFVIYEEQICFKGAFVDVFLTVL